MWLILTLLTWLGPAPRHDFHVSVAQVHHREGQWQVSLKVFTDDLQKAVSTELSGSKVQADSALARYLRVHFGLRTPQQESPPPLRYLGYEKEINLTYLYFYYPAPPSPAAVVIKNTFFMELFEDQVNIVNVTVGEELETAYLKQDTPRLKLQF